jgi:hypothetical protein
MKFKSAADASKYFRDIYGLRSFDIALSNAALPVVVGTKEFVKDYLMYDQRTRAADELQKQILKDYENNHARVMKEIRSFMISNKDYVLKKSFDRTVKYPKMKYPEFGDEAWDKITGTTTYEEWQTPKLVSSTIFNKTEYSYSLNDRSIVLNNAKELLDNSGNHTSCMMCETSDMKRKINPWKKVIIVEFTDYRQIEAFFNKDIAEILSIEVKQHLHQQNNTYTGNNILDDVDPMDLVVDPWFSDDKTRHSVHSITIGLPLCLVCLNKLKRNTNRHTKADEI